MIIYIYITSHAPGSLPGFCIFYNRYLIIEGQFPGNASIYTLLVRACLALDKS